MLKLSLSSSRTVLCGALSLLGCANNSGNTNVACDSLTRPPAAALPTWHGGTVFTIVMENHSRGEILGNPQAPYINQLANDNAVAEGYHDAFVHPSEPNYLWMVAGQNFGVLDDGDPASHHLASTSHLADQLELAGLSWKSYQESMGNPCGLTSHGRYAAKHNPFAYFDDINGWDGTAFHPEQRCNAHVVDYAQLDADIAGHALPSYVFITPNLDDDMHDGSIAEGDSWLARELPKLLATDNFKTSGVIFLLWDEGGGTPASDDPPFIAISPNAAHGMKSQTDYDTSSFLMTVQNLLGLQSLPCSAAADRTTTAAMTDLFTVPLAGH
ncbi:MAG TPA: alkaline phosphatase family protein [Kofleriaceae bacterium]|jgi:acid phosphatase|nr:alkaline phosphatase family protein [Kofleriaceae bacterium]